MNAWVSRNRLPLQHQAPEITKYRPGAALDCAIIATALAFQPSFDLDDAATSNYQQ